MATEYIIVNGEALELMEDGRFPVHFYFPEGTRLFDASSVPPRYVPLEDEGEDKGVTLMRLIPHAPYFAYAVAGPNDQVFARRIEPAVMPATAAAGNAVVGVGVGGATSLFGAAGAPAIEGAAPTAPSTSSSVTKPSNAPRSVLDDIYSAIPQSCQVFPALRTELMDRKFENLSRVATHTRYLPDGTQVQCMVERRTRDYHTFRNLMEDTDQRGLYRYIIVHGLAPTTTAEDIGKYFDLTRNQYVYEADVCYYTDAATGNRLCRSIGFVELRDLTNGTFKLLLERYLEFNGGYMYVVGSDRRPCVDVPKLEPFPTAVGPAPHREHIEYRRPYNPDRHNNRHRDGNQMHHNNNNNSDYSNNNGGEMMMGGNRHHTNNGGMSGPNGERRMHNNNHSNNNNGEFNNNNNGPRQNNNNGGMMGYNRNARPHNNTFGNNNNNGGNNNGPMFRDTRESRSEPLHPAMSSSASSSNNMGTPTNPMNAPMPRNDRYNNSNGEHHPYQQRNHHNNDRYNNNNGDRYNNNNNGGDRYSNNNNNAPSSANHNHKSVIYCIGHINEQVTESSVQDGVFMPSKRALDDLARLSTEYGAVYMIVIYDRHPMVFGLARVQGKCGNGQVAVQWTAPHRNVHAREVPHGLLHDLGIGEMNTSQWFDGLRVAEGGEGMPTKGNMAACQRLHDFLEHGCPAKPSDSPSTPTHPHSHREYRNHHNNNGGHGNNNGDRYNNHHHGGHNNNAYGGHNNGGGMGPRRAMNLNPL